MASFLLSQKQLPSWLQSDRFNFVWTYRQDLLLGVRQVLFQEVDLTEPSICSEKRNGGRDGLSRILVEPEHDLRICVRFFHGAQNQPVRRDRKERLDRRSEEHTSELQSRFGISYA